MFKNLMFNPSKVTSYELNCLDQRRKMEKQMVLDQDLKDDESSSDSKDDKMWFIISSDWLF